MSEVARKDRFPYGAIIYSNRGFYEHYGIYKNDNEVIHFSSKDNTLGINNADIIVTSLSVFSKGDFVSLKPEESGGYSSAKTGERAESQVGIKKGKYSLLFNNCEHFARWCKYNTTESKQVNTVAASVALTTAGIATPQL